MSCPLSRCNCFNSFVFSFRFLLLFLIFSYGKLVEKTFHSQLRISQILVIILYNLFHPNDLIAKNTTQNWCFAAVRCSIYSQVWLLKEEEVLFTFRTFWEVEKKKKFWLGHKKQSSKLKKWKNQVSRRK